jgi:hypothetical protein
MAWHQAPCYIWIRRVFNVMGLNPWKRLDALAPSIPWQRTEYEEGLRRSFVCASFLLLSVER